MKEIGDEWIASTADEVISVGEPLPRIAAVQVSDGRRVQVTWRDGRSVIVDLAPVLLSHRHSIPLRDNDELFQTVRVNDDGVALESDGGIELTAEWIERLPAAGMDNAEFRQIMTALGLTLDGMAAQLEVSRRLVAQFRGSKPIPNYIALAVRYLALQGSAPAASQPDDDAYARLGAWSYLFRK